MASHCMQLTVCYMLFGAIISGDPRWQGAPATTMASAERMRRHRDDAAAAAVAETPEERVTRLHQQHKQRVEFRSDKFEAALYSDPELVQEHYAEIVSWHYLACCCMNKFTPAIANYQCIPLFPRAMFHLTDNHAL